VKRILITGMSGTGKLTVIERLAERGYKAIDLDDDWWCEDTLVPDLSDLTGQTMEAGRLWRADRVQALLDAEDAEAFFIGGCESNQGDFYPQLDHIALLTAPPSVILERVATRSTNPYGSSPDDRDRILTHTRAVEPLLRSSADVELDTSVLPVEDVVKRIVALATT
jgi:RNase adaptor protein for sRNA GlmZ degradation